MVRTLYFLCLGCGFNPWWGNCDPCNMLLDLGPLLNFSHICKEGDIVGASVRKAGETPA